MTYTNIKKAVFLERPNRFIAHIELNGNIEVCHVKNTGRCKELLVPGATIFVQEFDSSTRKTKYDLISVLKGDRLINMDSQVPNKVFYEWASDGHFLPNITHIKPETKYGNSRFDFYMETPDQKIFVEVKGVTLEEHGVAMFPDAPTERGVKHIGELIEAKQQGYESYLIFVIQMEHIQYFTPNSMTHEAFALKLNEAQEQGVHILAMDCHVSENSIVMGSPVRVQC